MTDYSDALMEHFLHPRNIGEIPDADGVGSVGDPGCGDFIKVWIKIEEEHIVDIKFKCSGCPAAIATSSVMTELAMGKHIDDAVFISDHEIADAVGGLTEEKIHCSVLGASALYRAIMNYVFKDLPTGRPRSF